MHELGLIGFLNRINNPIHINMQTTNPQGFLRPLTKKRFETAVANSAIARQFAVPRFAAQQLSKLRGDIQILMHQIVTPGALQLRKRVADGSAVQTRFHGKIQPTFKAEIKNMRNIETQSLRTGTKTVE